MTLRRGDDLCARGSACAFAHRPADPWLSAPAVAHESEFAARLGLAGVPAAAERIMLERDLALAELTGARLIVDQVSAADALPALRRAKERGLDVHASVSINHLSFNELDDIGDYRTFYKLGPAAPWRGRDRQALIDALAEGLIDVVVSAHAPAPAEDKRLPFDEAAPGAVGLETLLPALLALHHDGRLPLVDLIGGGHPVEAGAVARVRRRRAQDRSAPPTWCFATSARPSGSMRRAWSPSPRILRSTAEACGERCSPRRQADRPRRPRSASTPTS